MAVLSSPSPGFTHRRPSAEGGQSVLTEEPSPLYQPAFMQGQVPPWAVTTPSPMPFHRWPQPEAKASPVLEPKDAASFSKSETQASAVSSLVPHDLLWEVCAPFISEMLEALQHVIDDQFEQAMQASSVQATTSDGGLTASSLHQAPKSDPFHSLFVNPKNSPKVQTQRGPFGSLFKGTPNALSKVPIEEAANDHEGGFSPGSSSRSTPTIAVRTAGGHGDPHKIQFVTPMDDGESRSGKSSSKGSSPFVTPMCPNLQSGKAASQTVSPSGGSHRHISSGAPVSSTVPSSNSMGNTPAGYAGKSMDTPTRTLSQKSLSMAYNGMPTDVMYVSWQQQQVIDQHVDDAHQAMSRTTGSTSSQVFSRLSHHDVEAIVDEGVGASVSSEPANASETKPKDMICRHWITKGWCRMEANCKFQHPPEQRATPVIIPKGRRNASRGGMHMSGVASQIEASGRSHSPKRTRRAGRNRYFAKAIAATHR